MYLSLWMASSAAWRRCALCGCARLRPRLRLPAMFPASRPPANAEFANLFGVHRGSPVLYVENVVMDQNDRPIDLSKEYLDGVTQKFEFEVVNQ